MSSAAVLIGALRAYNIYVDKMQLDFPEVCGSVLIRKGFFFLFHIKDFDHSTHG